LKEALKESYQIQILCWDGAANHGIKPAEFIVFRAIIEIGIAIEIGIVFSIAIPIPISIAMISYLKIRTHI